MFGNMDWVHCNLCFTQPNQQNKRDFVLTSCGHVFCVKCEIQATADSTCKVCNRKCSTVKLNSKLKPDVQEYFNEPEKMLQKSLHVMEFQKTHRERLLKMHKLLVEKYQMAKLYIQRLEDELKCLRRELAYYAKPISDASPTHNATRRIPVISSTPSSSPSPSMGPTRRLIPPPPLPQQQQQQRQHQQHYQRQPLNHSLMQSSFVPCSPSRDDDNFVKPFPVSYAPRRNTNLCASKDSPSPLQPSEYRQSMYGEQPRNMHNITRRTPPSNNITRRTPPSNNITRRTPPSNNITSTSLQ